jgi:hypothetical protein
VKVPAGKTVTLHFQTDSLLPHTSFHVEKVDWKLLTQEPGVSRMFVQRVIPSRY